MTEQTLAPGRIVHYRLNLSDCEKIKFNRDKHGLIGNVPNPGDVVPVMVVKVWSADLINGKAMLDGEDNLWITSAGKAVGDETGTWFWPQRAAA